MRADSTASVRWHAGALNNGLIFSLTYHGCRWLPRAISYALGDSGTWIAYHTIRRGTDAMVENMRVVCPDRSERERRRLVRLTYKMYARDTVDFIRSLSLSPEAFAPMIAELDSGRFEELLAQGRGVILIGGHFGNWELGGIALRRLRGYPVTVVGRPEPSPIVGEFRKKMRDSFGIESLEIGQMLETALQLRRLLASNRIVAMLLDRHLGRDRVDVTFFGKETAFLRSPAMLSLMSGAPLLPSFMIRQPDGRFVGLCGEPIHVDRALPPDEAVKQATQAFATQLEAQIRANPQLWYQFYAYWEPA